MRKLLTYIALFVLLIPVNGQTKDTDKKHTNLTVRYHQGLVIPHHVNMLYFIDDFSRGLEVTYGRQLFDENSWESYFNYPEIGLGFYYGTFGNKDIFGAGLALFPYINYNIHRSPKLNI